MKITKSSKVVKNFYYSRVEYGSRTTRKQELIKRIFVKNPIFWKKFIWIRKLMEINCGNSGMFTGIAIVKVYLSVLWLYHIPMYKKRQHWFEFLAIFVGF